MSKPHKTIDRAEVFKELSSLGSAIEFIQFPEDNRLRIGFEFETMSVLIELTYCLNWTLKDVDVSYSDVKANQSVFSYQHDKLKKVLNHALCNVEKNLERSIQQRQDDYLECTSVSSVLEK